MSPVRLFVLALLAAVASGPRAQGLGGLQIREAVTVDAPGDTTGMRRAPIVTAPGSWAWVGRSALDLEPGSIETVGLEVGLEGATLSLWLSDEAGAAFAALTARSVGRALAVVHRGRVLAAPVVQSAIPNGLVLITGLDADEGRRLADALRDASDVQENVLPVLPSDPGLLIPGGLGDEDPGAVALAWGAALARRDWRGAAALLHPDAVAASRPDALALLRVEGATVRVRDGQAEGSLSMAAVLGRAPAVAHADQLDGGDLAALYLAALDVLGAWDAPGPPRAVAGTVADGARVHVVLRADAAARGLADVSVVAVSRDDAGRWRVLLTQARGF